MTSYWPYEQRFEVLTERPFDELDDETWHEVAARAGATIMKHGRAPGIRHFVLSTSSLLVLPRRVILASCARTGIRDSILYLFDRLVSFVPTYALLERRLPIGRHRLAWDSIDTGPIEQLPPITGCTEAGIFHRWPLPSRDVPPSTLAVLMHDLAGYSTLEDVKKIVQQEFPHLLFCGHQFDADGFSFNAVGDGSFLTMHHTAGAYASFECCVNDWGAADALLERLVHLCRPGSVVPVWHGVPPGLGDSRVAARP